MMDRSMDELMWLLADEGDHNAVEAFIKRHPEHRAELIRRVNMVREMRGAKRTPGAGKSFTPSESVRDLAGPDRRLLLGAVATFAVFIIGFAAMNVRNRQSGIAEAPAAIATTTNQESAAPSPAPELDPNMNVVPRTPAPPPPPPLYETPVTVESDSIDLLMVFSEITRQTGLRIEMGPGMPNPKISATYFNVRAKAVLEDLGAKVGFTVFEQGPDHILIIPARESIREDAPAEVTDPQPENSTGDTEREDLPVITEP